jgi:hypothetical protein
MAMWGPLGALGPSGVLPARAAAASAALYCGQTAWYLHNAAQRYLGVATATGRDMSLHHGASLALLVLSWAAGLRRIGVLAMVRAAPPWLPAGRLLLLLLAQPAPHPLHTSSPPALQPAPLRPLPAPPPPQLLFNASNPLLHLSRVARYLELHPLAKWGAFLAFAAAFLVTRVVLLPPVLLAVAWHGGRDHLAPPLFWATNALLWLLYVLQLFWMCRIAGIIATGRAGEAGGLVAGRARDAGVAEEGGEQQQAPAAVAAVGPPSPAAAGSKPSSGHRQRRARRKRA